MVKNKKIREIIGYTHSAENQNEKSWNDCANSFHSAAKLLYKKYDNGGDGDFFRTAVFNAAMSIELMLKTKCIKKPISIPKIHNLLNIANDLGLKFSAEREKTLRLFTAHLIWASKYPVPLKEGDWDTYHDDILEEHIVRERNGNYFATRVDPDTFPSYENYLLLWNEITSFNPD